MTYRVVDHAVSWWADPRWFDLEPPSSPEGLSMKPSPDDPHQVEPPKTRANYSMDAEESARPRGPQADGTEYDATRKMAQSSGYSSFHMGSNPGSTPVSTGGTPVRGVSGKIEPNMTLYGKYHVLKKLGGGAMGDVWLVRHASMGDLHAL